MQGSGPRNSPSHFPHPVKVRYKVFGGRVWRVLFYLVCLLLWLLVMGGISEFWWRWQHPQQLIVPDEVHHAIHTVREEFEPIYARYSAKWPFPAPEIPTLDQIADSTEEERRQIARQRGEWILMVHREGRIHSTYGERPAPFSQNESPSPLNIDDLADEVFTVSVHENLAACLRDQARATVTLPATCGQTSAMLSVVFQPLMHQHNTEKVIVAISPSIYRHGIKRFVPDIAPRTFDTTIMMEQFSTNSHGFRGPEVSAPKPPGVIRIACIGGSTTVWGYTDELTYPAMLQHQLRSIWPEHAARIEVVNGGIFGLTSPEEIEMIDEIALLEPDILIYYNFINDLTVHLPPWMDSREAWRGVLPGLKRILRRSALLRQYASEYLLPPEQRVKALLRKSTLDNIEILVERARDYKMLPVFCSFAGLAPHLIPARHRPYADIENISRWLPGLNVRDYTAIRLLYNDALHRLCSEKRVPYIPVAENIQAGYDLFRDLCHFNPRGTEQQALIVFEHIKPIVETLLHNQSVSH